MREYRGLTNDAIIAPAGDFPKQNGWGGECWNFRAWRRHMYGYARVNSRGDPAPVVRRLNLGTDADKVDEVTVVWVAHQGAIDKTYVIGWFKNSTIVNRFVNRPDADRIAEEAQTAGIELEVGQEELQYFVTCKKEDAKLLTEGEREFRVPIGRGWMARQSLLFYPDGGPDHENLKGRLLDYITACTSSQTTLPVPYSAMVEPLDERSTIEGEQVLVTHAVRERDAGIVRRAKERFRKVHGRLFCEACAFDFQAKYGSLGEGFIEAHHVTPLAEGSRYTNPDDLMMLCANCHRMVHRQMDRKQRRLTREESAAIATQGGS